MKRFLFFGFFLFSCASKPSDLPMEGCLHSEHQKLKQKAALLERKYQKAQKNLLNDQKEMEKKRSELCTAQLDAIELKLKYFEKRFLADRDHLIQTMKCDVSSLFIRERETLIQILQNGPDLMRSQALLDRILQFITQMSEYLKKDKYEP